MNSEQENEAGGAPVVVEGATDLKTVLAAWNLATVRLQETHECLRSEVRRLTDELETKNRQLAQGSPGRLGANGLAHCPRSP